MTHPPMLDGLPVWVSDANTVWPTLRIARSIPLSRLEWLWVSRGASLRDASTSARAVFEISTSKEPAIPEPARDACEWFSNPYVYTLVTTVQALTTSKENSWTRIRSFVEDCKERLYEYLIVLAATDVETTEHRRIVEKLRTELNLTARGRERFVIVPPAAIREEQRPITYLHHSSAHQDLLVRLRECAREGAEARVQAYEDEVSRSYLNRSSTSWSFAKFFALKEGMAFVFVQLGRRDMAVRFYDELQATMTERNERGYGAFCDQKAADAALGVTNPEAKEYRKQLVEERISELDLRTYLFARQISLMLKDRKFAEVAERGLKFITALARRCAEEALDKDGSVSGVFRDTWVFCTARALAAALTPAIPSPSEADAALSVQLSSSKERHTARLIAGFHVHAMKAFMGLAHVTLPGCLAPEDPDDTRDTSMLAEEARETSNERLQKALESRNNAEVLHSEVANAAASLYEMGGRARGAAALDGDAGVVRLRNGSYSEAETLLSAQCTKYINDNGWDDLHRRQRVHLARAEKELDRVQEYLVSCLTLLYMSRQSRMQWKRTSPDTEPGDESRTMEDAAHWASEAASVSTRLPRIMKYKADRLFDVSVLPNEALWLEGDPGVATVRIRSDIPTTITVDSVVMECRHSDVAKSAPSKSAMQSREEGSVLGPSSDNMTVTKGHDSHVAPHPPNTSPSIHDMVEEPGVVILQSDTNVDIVRGMNDIVVHVTEVPHLGRYRVTVVAMFLGNLKLIQMANKTSPTPLVTTKGAGSVRSPSPPRPSAFPEHGKAEVRFPMFFASARSPSASLKIDQQILYLAPDSVQFVYVKVIAGNFGIKGGARVTCSLLSPTRARLSGVERFVTFDESAAEQDSSMSQSGPASLRVRDVPSEQDGPCTVGEAVLQEELNSGQELDMKIALRLSKDCTRFRNRNMSPSTEDKSCILRLGLSCLEKDSACTRRFVCSVERKLLFASPLEVSARIELNSEWGGENVSRTVGLHGDPLGDGGTLLCAVRRRTRSSHTMTIRSAVLETPSWLELRPDEVPPHAELLPFTLGEDGLFTFVFDVLTKHEVDQQTDYDSGHGEAPDIMFEKNTAEFRLSRTIASSPRVEESQDDMSRWALERSQLVLGSGETQEVSLNRPVVRSQPRNVEETLALGNSASQKDSYVSESETDYAHVATTVGGEAPESPSYPIAGEEEQNHPKEAGDVVDLSGRGDEAQEISVAISQTPRNTSNMEELATLRLEISIDGPEPAVESEIERKIYMSALRKLLPRYRIERSILKIGEAGKMIELQFAVRMTGAEKSDDMMISSDSSASVQVKSLQYEIDADPTVWLVVGRRRGKLNAMTGFTTVSTTKVVPLVSGRQRVPFIRLFSSEGRGLPPSQYENVNDCMQVVIMPSGTVISACSADLPSLAGDDALNSSSRKAVKNMPEVVASDSFFES